MSERRYIVIHFNGKWDGISYSGGTSKAVYIHDKAHNFSTLTQMVHKAVQVDLTEYEYDIFELVSGNGKLVMLPIEDDTDVFELLKQSRVPEVYVTTKSAKPRMVDQLDEDLVGSCSSFTQRSFVELMETFNALKGKRQLNHPSNTIMEEVEDIHSEDLDNEVRSDNDTSTGTKVPSNDSSSHDASFENASENPLEIHSSGENNVIARPWSVPGIPSSFSPAREDSPPLNCSPGEICKGSIFNSKLLMKKSVGYYHMNEHVECRVKQSDKRRWNLKCKHENCNFKFHAVGKNDLWRTLKFSAHTCRMDPNCNAPRSLPSKVIGSYFAENQQEESTSMTPTTIVKSLKKVGLNILYSQAVRAKRHADELIHGDPDESFKLLPSYLHVLQVANPDSHVRLEIDNENRFKYVFYALQASIRGFVDYGRPVVVVDGTQLRGKYKGIVFVAVTQDGNRQIFPLAMGIGDVENNESWTWFLSKLREAYGCPEDMLIVSDQHASIIHGVKMVYPDATHGLCYYHLKKKYKVHGDIVVSFIKKATYAYRDSEYRRIMARLKHLQIGNVYQSLIDTLPKRWSRVRCPVRRYEFMTSNAAESWNKRIRWARRLPIVNVLESMRKITQDWFYVRLTDAKSRNEVLCKFVIDRLSNLNDKADKCLVEPLTNYRYKVVSGTMSHLVDLDMRTCECCVFQELLIPCYHALAAIRFDNYDVTQFVDKCYSSVTLEGMWGGSIMPVPEPSEWVVPDHIKLVICNPPLRHRPAGRPKLTRMRSTTEQSSSSVSKRQRCGRCKEPCHNRVKCRVRLSPSDTVNVDGRRPRRCSICREVGHTKRKCPRV